MRVKTSGQILLSCSILLFDFNFALQKLNSKQTTKFFVFPLYSSSLLGLHHRRLFFSSLFTKKLSPSFHLSQASTLQPQLSGLRANDFIAVKHGSKEEVPYGSNFRILSTSRVTLTTGSRSLLVLGNSSSASFVQ